MKNWLIVGYMALALSLAFALPAVADETILEDGVHYTTLQDGIESLSGNGDPLITEFFWYGCPFCNAFDPYMESFLAETEIEVRKVPAILSQRHALHGRIYYTWKSLGLPADTHQAIYAQIHEEGNQMLDDEGIDGFFASVGVDPEEFKDRFFSASVDRDSRNAVSLGQLAGIHQTPTFLVNGRYLVASSLPGIDTNEQALDVAAILATGQPE